MGIIKDLPTQKNVQKIPSVIKPFVYARSMLSFVGEFNLAHLPRVKEVVTKDSILNIGISFKLEEDKIKANVWLTFDAYLPCAKCLTDIVFHCDKESHIIFTSDLDSIDDEMEYIEITDTFAEFDTKEFIAEEVLLNLPMLVKHDYACVDLQESSENGESAHTQKPFLNLKDLYT